MQDRSRKASTTPGEFFLAWPFAVGLVLMDELRRWLIRRLAPAQQTATAGEGV